MWEEAGASLLVVKKSRFYAHVYRITKGGRRWLENARIKQFIGNPRYRISVRQVSEANKKIYLNAFRTIKADLAEEIVRANDRLIIRRERGIVPEPGQEDGPGTLFYQGGYGS